ncbi:hypothetical protein C8J57DRAFT_1513349 [Mycena rebaudengoi]|nr:hypothetical protein C8J57DRAFT_1513349 [Mycena rebaudengoi]
MAAKLIRTHASREALNSIDRMDVDERDYAYRQWTMWNMDVLPYLQLREAIKAGDVGRIEDLMPTLLFRFAGGGNPKYTIEMLELFQGMKREWPQELRQLDSWLPFDLCQEENIADIKIDGPGCHHGVHGQSFSSNTDLAQGSTAYGKTIQDLLPWCKHGVPDKERDVAKLVKHYFTSKLHVWTPGRQLKTPHSTDFITEGANNLERLKTIEAWFLRRTHERATGEDWSEDAEYILLAPLLSDLSSEVN